VTLLDLGLAVLWTVAATGSDLAAAVLPSLILLIRALRFAPSNATEFRDDRRYGNRRHDTTIPAP